MLIVLEGVLSVLKLVENDGDAEIDEDVLRDMLE